MFSAGEWRLLRTKTDETADDPNWAGENDVPTEPVGNADIVVPMPASVGANGLPLAGVEVVVLGTTAARVPVDRGSGTVDIQLVEVISRENPQFGGTSGDDELVVDSLAVTAVPLNRPVYFELSGARGWTVRLTNDVALAGTVTQLQVWWRAVYR